MPNPVPESVRATLGEEGAEDLVRWLDDYLQERTVHRDEFRKVLSRLDVLEERISQLEERMGQRFEQVDQRAHPKETASTWRSEARVARLEDQFHELQDDLLEQQGRFDRRIDDVQSRSRIRWLVGTISFFGILLTILIASRFLS